MARVEVLSGPERRRKWSAEQKEALLAEAFGPGGVVRAVAQRADVMPSLLYRWRREMRASAVGFREVLVTRDAPGDDGSAAAAIEIEVLGRARVRIRASTPPLLATAVIEALTRR